MTRRVSPAGANGLLSVLIFHRVLAQRDPLNPSEPDAVEFGRILTWISSQFAVLPLSEGVARLRSGTLPPAAASITFDDGYRDNLEIAAPALAGRGLPATFFISSGYLDGGTMFNDLVIEAVRSAKADSVERPHLGLPRLPLRSLEERRHAIQQMIAAIKYLAPERRQSEAQSFVEAIGGNVPENLMMTSSELRDLDGLGFEIGAHTSLHPILRSVSEDAARQEIASGRDQLESLLGKRVALFAYPNGREGKDFDASHCDLVDRLGFDAAFSTEPGACGAHSDLRRLPRFTPWDRTAGRFQLRMLANCMRSRVAARRVARERN